MTVAELSPVALFSIHVAAIVHCGLAALAFAEARKSWRGAEPGERFMWCAGLAALVGSPMLVAFSVMA